MERKIVRLANAKEFGSKAYLREAQVGKWYKFEVRNIGANATGYGKVTAILEDGKVEVEKYFELPSYRPYAATSWYDKLPYAI